MQIINCPFCGMAHEFRHDRVGCGLVCKCGAYGRTDYVSDAYLFAGEAAEVFGIDPFRYEEGKGYERFFHLDRYLEVRDSGKIFEGDEDGNEFVVLQWARKKIARALDQSAMESISVFCGVPGCDNSAEVIMIDGSLFCELHARQMEDS